MNYIPLYLAISPVWIVIFVVLGILVAAFTGLYFYGRKQQKKMAENAPKIEAAAQTYTILVIDKKKMRMKDADFPQSIMDAVPRLNKMAKVPIVKAKIGARIMNLISEPNLFDLIPVKQEVRASISGIYITKITAIHGTQIKDDKKAKKNKKKNKK
ncbi:MAG: hypothetical protein IJM62_06180 [Lachnospiraceae bacterium]|nr:hypothetical protein [Lachnospiraceae bacterium]